MFIPKKCLKGFLVIAGILIFSPLLKAQGPDTLWTRTYGGSNDDYGHSVQQTSDGEYIITGGTHSFGAGGYDVYLIKTNSLGNTLWTETYGGSDDDYGYSVQQTSDGGYIIVGSTKSFGAGDEDVYLIKIDSVGDTLWTKTYGGSDYDRGYSVQQTSDGGYIIAGYTTSFGAGDEDVYLIKTDSLGDTLWTKTYGGSDYDYGYSVQQTSDGGYIITGGTRSFGAGNGDVYLIKIDSVGDTLWTKTYGGSNDDWGYSVHQTSDGGYIITGSTKSFGAGNGDVYLIKIDSVGDTLWTKTYGGSNDDWGYSVHQTSDGGYIITGGTQSFGAGYYDVYLLKTDSLGDTLWTKTYGGSNGDRGNSVQQTSDGGYILAGKTESFGAGYGDVYLIRVTEGIIVSLPDTMGFIGEPIGVPLQVRNDVTGLDIIVCNGSVVYNSNILQLDSVSLGPMSQGWNLTWELVPPDTLQFSMLSGGNPLEGVGNLLEIYFTPTDTGYSALSFADFSFNYGNVPSYAADGCINVTNRGSAWISSEFMGEEPDNDTFLVFIGDTFDLYALGRASGCVNSITFNIKYDAGGLQYLPDFFEYWLPLEWEVINMGGEPFGPGFIYNFAADSLPPFNPLWCDNVLPHTLFKVPFVVFGTSVIDTGPPPYRSPGLLFGTSSGNPIYPLWGGPYTIFAMLPGDANGDGSVGVSDLIYLANYFFGGGPPPDPLILGDENGDCSVDPVDLIYLANYLFGGGPPPVPCPDYSKRGVTVNKSPELLNKIKSPKLMQKIPGSKKIK